MTKCQHLKKKCVDSRQMEWYRWRRYQCLDCPTRISTIEVVVDRGSKGVALNKELGELMARLNKTKIQKLLKLLEMDVLKL